MKGAFVCEAGGDLALGGILRWRKRGSGVIRLTEFSMHVGVSSQRTATAGSDQAPVDSLRVAVHIALSGFFSPAPACQVATTSPLVRSVSVHTCEYGHGGEVEISSFWIQTVCFTAFALAAKTRHHEF